MKLLLSMALLTQLTPVSAMTDFKCMNDCTQAGYMYQFCQSKCTVDDQQSMQMQPARPVQPYQGITPIQQPPRTDFTCMSNCQDAGYQYGYCKSRCSY